MRTQTRLLIAAGMTLALLTGASGPAVANPSTPHPRAWQETLDAIHDAGMAGAFAEVRDGRHVWRGAAGVADVDTGRPMRPGFQHRVGSITKTFTATVILQLAGEGRLGLDDPIGRFVPDLVPDDLATGVTVRMLLNHTSGIADYDTVLFPDLAAMERLRHVTIPPSRLVALGLSEPRTGAPGERWSYSNTNYILAGVILERITGRSAESEFARRIIRPLGLRNTYLPGRSPYIRGPHSEGYVPWPDGTLRDFSVYNMSWTWTAGALVSSASDLNRFYRALLGGRLLRPAQLAQMKTTVPIAPGQQDGGYGLGIAGGRLGCGIEAWGHDGLVIGYYAMSYHAPTVDRHVSYGDNMAFYGPPDHPVDQLRNAFWPDVLCGAADAVHATGSSPGVFAPDRGFLADRAFCSW
ncbi:serine hydrolase domain-containing protein [Actinoplanes aureus]|uniref:Beta-lactamase family protein n=1 Tax=Actinoplanes aureus TaxID=2792083 RepID=A0A931CEF3_9ACTN|nr:serine hydrolase domain-containing protein [Actinoplanes aureus]MBG0565688.1 beta-lactamase family protein [Actinoplanes aureus]